MRHITQIALMGGIIAALWSMPVLRAEDHGVGMKDKGHHPEMMEQCKEKLGLSNDQAKKLETAFKTLREAQEPLHKQFKQDLKKLDAQITLKYSDSDIQTTLDQLKKDHAAMQAAHEKFISDLSAFLTPTQRGKLLVKFLEHMHGGFGHPMMMHEGMGFGAGHAHGEHWTSHKGHDEQGEDMKDAPFSPAGDEESDEAE